MKRSKLITRQDIDTFERLEKCWVEDEKSYQEFWDQFAEVEDDLFDWLQQRCEKYLDLLGTKSIIAEEHRGAVADMLVEVFCNGLFFGEGRWRNKEDIDGWLKEALGEA